MGERDKSEGREFDPPVVDLTAAAVERARKLQVLMRVSVALNVPIETFFEAAADRDVSEERSDGDGKT